MPKVAPPLFRCTVTEPFLLAIPGPPRRALAWALVTAFAGTYYALPLLILASAVLGPLGYPRVAALLVALLVVGATYPTREWPAARRACQMFYEIFDVKHNLTEERIAHIVERCVDDGDRYILGMRAPRPRTTPHAAPCP